MTKYVVAGATGRVGSVVARELLDRNEAVTVVVRDEARRPEWARRGADVAVGSLDDRAFVARVVRDAAGFFTLLPENVPPDDFHGARRRMAGAIPAAMQAGIYPNFLASADAPIAMIAGRDVGWCAAQALLSPPQGREIVDLLGPAYSIRQVAQTLGRALDKELQVVDIPPARQSDTLSGPIASTDRCEWGQPCTVQRVARSNASSIVASIH